MEEFRLPIQGAEPYEEASDRSQGRDVSSVASPDDLAAFYKDMERKEILERKLSKKSIPGASIWSRKLSLKRSATAHPTAQPLAQNSHQPPQKNNRRDAQRREEEERVTVNHHDSDKPDWVLPMNSPRSIIPDSKDLPASYNKDAWDSVPKPSHRLRYNLHNPVGPRWYKNHHLIPPSESTPGARPPSVFSPSFPPLAPSASQDRLEDPTRPGPSRTPSNSPLPTPNSSQTRVEDKPRVRKTSETAHDVVDLWDVTDPWGTNWHHSSPYDIGLSNGPISADVQDVLQTRSRRSSMDQSRGKTVAPSPLSQSTSAIHLQVKPDPVVIQVPRKLSKRRTPTVATVFGGQSQDGRHVASLPATSMETQLTSSDLPKRMSVAAPLNGFSMSSPNISPKKEKRGSILDRLVKKFTLLTKSAVRDDDWQHISSDHAVVDPAPQPSFPPSFPPSRQTSPEKVPEVAKRVPPPPVEAPIQSDEITKETDSSSVTSLEAPFSIGRLTIANPDVPMSGETTPAQKEVPLPPSKESLGSRSQHKLNRESISPPTPQPYVNPPIPPVKTPPPPTPPTKSSNEVLPEICTTSPFTIPIPIRRPSFEQQRTEPSPQVSTLTHYAPSIITIKSQASFGDSQVPGLPVPTISSYRSEYSSRKPPPATDRPASRSSQLVQPIPPPPQKVRPASIASSVPFPAVERVESLHLYHEYDNSPLSAASMLANPPTPYTNAEIDMLATPDHPPPPLPLKISTDVPARQTETFRLVRSPSGNVYDFNEKIVAGGQQWEVVGAFDKSKGKGSSSSKEQTPKESEPQSSDRHISDRESKSRDRKETDRTRDSRVHDSKRDSRVRDRDRDHVRDSRDRDYVRDSRDKDYVRDSRDKDYVRDSRNRDGVRDSRDRDYVRDSRDRNYVRESRDREHAREYRDKEHARESRDRERVRESRDREYAREYRDRDRDYGTRNERARDSKDRVHKSSNRLEKKRESKIHVEPEPEPDSRHRHRSQRDSRTGAAERSTTVPKSISRAFEAEARREESKSAPLQTESARADPQRDDRERKSSRKRHETSPNVSPTKAKPAPPPPGPDPSISRLLGRHPSLSTRPTSQLPSADEMNAMRAKEAWDMERLWKARSMEGDELNRYTTIPSNQNTPLMGNINPTSIGSSSLYGSSHTAFVVQTPFQPQHSIYHSMPAAPPPIIYSSPSSIPKVTHQVPPIRHRQPRTQIYAESVASDQKSYTSSRAPNPLPEVPRESSYEIPAEARTSEYWTKYAGLAALT